MRNTVDSQGPARTRPTLALAQQIPGDPQVVDCGVPVTAEARHRAEILDHEVCPGPHHKAAALLCELARNPSLEVRNIRPR